MLNFANRTTLSILLLATLGSHVTYAKTDSTRKPWTLDEAVALVDSKHYGQLLRVRLVNSVKDECPIYRVRILTLKGRIKSYFVDGCLRDFVKAPPKNKPVETNKG